MVWKTFNFIRPATNNQVTGEFGPIYERKEYNPDFEEHNEERYKMLDKQMAIYTDEGIGRTICDASS